MISCADRIDETIEFLETDKSLEKKMTVLESVLREIDIGVRVSVISVNQGRFYAK